MERSQVGVLAKRLLDSTESKLSRKIDYRRKELVHAKGCCFDRNDVGHLFYQLGVKRATHSDG